MVASGNYAPPGETDRRLFSLFEGTRDSSDRSSAQPSSSRAVQPRQAVITRSHTAVDRKVGPHMGIYYGSIYMKYCRCSPDQACKSLWTQVIIGYMPTLRPRINPYGPEVTLRVAPTPTGPRISPYGCSPRGIAYRILGGG
ncbi:hypothetical protein GQ457_15G024470 [Hibiscus cannabinus]